MCTQKLRYVLFDLGLEWEQDMNALKETLEKEGVSCARLTEAIRKAPEELRKQMVVLTDSTETGRRLAQEGIVYFGCHHRNRPSKNQEVICSRQPAQKEQRHGQSFQNTLYDTVPHERICEKKPDSDTVWFDGAALVLEGFEEVDAKYLEEWMLRAQGLPAEIARTDRLVIREMMEEDLFELMRIGRQSGSLELESGLGEVSPKQETAAFASDDYEADLQGDIFTEEGLQAYIQNAYRLQGFGLWSVLYEGRVIGCCGFEPCAGQDIYTHRMILNLEEEGQLCEREAGKYQKEEGQSCKREAGKYQKEEGRSCERRTDDGRINEDQANEDRTANNGRLDKARLDEGLMDNGQMNEGRTDGKPPLERQENEYSQGLDDSKLILEMQYMLDFAYHRQGFGTEMCRAALTYARERLGADEVRLKIREENCASLALAGKLGFW